MRHLIEDFFVFVIENIDSVIYDIDYWLCMNKIDEHKVIKNKIVDFLCGVVCENIEIFFWGLGGIVVYGHWEKGKSIIRKR